MSDKRNIFSWKNHAGKTVYGDPLVLIEALHHGCAEIQQSFEELWVQSDVRKDNGDPDPNKWPRDILQTYEPREILRGVACEVFDMPPFDPETGEGTLAHEIDDLLNRFISFVREKKT